MPEELGTVDAVVQFSFAVHAVLGRHAAAHDVSITQLRLFGILRDRDPGVVEIARHLGLSKSSVSGLIDRAERRGLVTRTAAPVDGRGVIVTLTDEGRRLTERVAAEIGDEIVALLAPLTAPDRERLTRLAGLVAAGRSVSSVEFLE